MTQTLQYLILAACLALSAIAAAQQPDAAAPTTTADAEQTDLGTLQAELARVEAERQRLAQRLSNNTDTQELEQLRETNRELQNQQIENAVQARTLLEQQRQRWFLVGGGTVVVSLLIGFMLARVNRGKRNEWMN